MADVDKAFDATAPFNPVAHHGKADHLAVIGVALWPVGHPATQLPLFAKLLRLYDTGGDEIWRI